MPDSDIKPNHNEWMWTLLICITLAAATFAAFEGVKNNGFVNYDDNVYVTENPFVQGGLNLKSIQWAFTSLYAGNWHPTDVVKPHNRLCCFRARPDGSSSGQCRNSYRERNPAFFDIEKNDGCVMAKCVCRCGFRSASPRRGISCVGRGAEKYLEYLFRVFDNSRVFALHTKARPAAICCGCGLFRGWTAFQTNGGDASVCIDPAGLLADSQVLGWNWHDLAEAGACREGAFDGNIRGIVHGDIPGAGEIGGAA